MGTKAYITRASLSYRVIVFSFRHEEPIDISAFVTSIRGSRSVTGSTQNTFDITMKKPEVSLLFQGGDWLQIDLEMAGYPTEHIFFGQIMLKGSNESVVIPGGGIQEVASVQVIHWGSVFDRFMRDLNTYLRVNANTLNPWQDEYYDAPSQGGPPRFENLENPTYPTPPNLASIAQGKLKAHPWQAVSMALHHLCRYGGALGQQFWLPTSYTGLTELVPLIEYVCRVNKTRLPADAVMGSTWQGFDSDTNNLIVQFEKRDVEDGVFKTNVPDDDRGWPYSDWHNTFAANGSFVPGQGFLRDFDGSNAFTFGNRQTLAGLALDLSDTAFNELTYTLQEHCTLGPQNPSEAIIPGTGEKVPFSRDFMMTVVLRPIPHPSWDSKADTLVVLSGDDSQMYTASRANYEQFCTKFVLGLGHSSGSQFQQTAHNAFNYFNAVPQDQELKGFEDWDAASMIKATQGRVPIIDEELTQTFGHMPMVVQTRYHMGSTWSVAPSVGGTELSEQDTIELPSPLGPFSVKFKRDSTPAWKVLASKALALYAWHGQGWEHYDGVVSTPIVDTNVPRPGDVGYLVSHELDRGAHFRNANRRWFEPKILAKQLTTGAISVYVDAVDYDLTMDAKTSVIKGALTIHFSHGVWCEMPSKPNGDVLPYKRFVDYNEVGIDPIYFLPAAPGALELQDELFSEFANPTAIDPKELVKEIEGDKDSTRNKERRKRARRRRKKTGLKRTEPKSTNVGGTAINLTLVKYSDYEPPEETKRTKQNPAKKAVGPRKVLVGRMVEVEQDPVNLFGAQGGPLGHLNLRKSTIKVKQYLPVKTNKYGEVDEADVDKAFSVFDKKPKGN
jgi:hypothetical protein